MTCTSRGNGAGVFVYPFAFISDDLRPRTDERMFYTLAALVFRLIRLVVAFVSLRDDDFKTSREARLILHATRQFEALIVLGIYTLDSDGCFASLMFHDCLCGWKACV